jgi:hypothetical protein
MAEPTDLPEPPEPPQQGMANYRPGPARTQDSSDWRFAVLVLMVILIAVLGTGLVLYVQQDTFPDGVGNLASAVTGALIVIIGKRMI